LHRLRSKKSFAGVQDQVGSRQLETQESEGWQHTVSSFFQYQSDWSSC
jgi:hypothetical protein